MRIWIACNTKDRIQNSKIPSANYMQKEIDLKTSDSRTVLAGGQWMWKKSSSKLLLEMFFLPVVVILGRIREDLDSAALFWVGSTVWLKSPSRDTELQTCNNTVTEMPPFPSDSRDHGPRSVGCRLQCANHEKIDDTVTEKNKTGTEFFFFFLSSAHCNLIIWCM